MPTITGTSADDTLIGTSDDDVIDGLGGNDIIDGSFGADILRGGDGDDLFRFSAIQSSNQVTPTGLIAGGDGFDTLDFRSIWPVTYGTIRRDDGAFAQGCYVGSQKFEITSIERVLFGNRDDYIATSSISWPDQIFAGGGDDTITSGAYTSIFAEEGNDSLFLSGLFGGTSYARIDAGSGYDILKLNISFYVDLAAESASSGGAIFFLSRFEEVLACARGGYLTTVLGSAGADVLGVNPIFNDGTRVVFDGRDGDDIVTGGLGNDSLAGGAGDDQIAAGGGNDELIGGTGNDIFIVDQRGTTIIEYANEGIDEVRTTAGIYVLAANIENLTLTDNAAHVAIFGNMLDNVITGGTGYEGLVGDAGNDIIRGGAGAANELIGGTGNDIYVVEAGGDTIVEYAGEGTDTVSTALANYTLRTNVENLVYTGTAAFGGVGSADSNAITGGIGTDSLIGNDGNDVLTGGSGADLLIGGNGADQFRYLGGESGFDRITDFTSGSDQIVLSTTGFVHTATVAYLAGAAANSTNSTFLYNSNTGMLSYDADGNGAGVAVALAQLNAGLTLTVSDFIFN